MNLFIPSEGRSLFKSKKKNRKLQLMKKIFTRINIRWQRYATNPFTIKHLSHLNKKNSRFQEYFKSVNNSIDNINRIYRIRVQQFYSSGCRFQLEKLVIEDPTIQIDTFNILMKQKLLCETSKNFYIKKKQKISKIKMTGDIESCLYKYLIGEANHDLF